MGEDMRALAEKEVKRMEGVLSGLKVVDNRALELYNLVLSYTKDARHFFEKGDYVRAFEAAVISWAWVDAGLHLSAFSVADDVRKDFTID
jgi:hypothetical protein